MRINRVFPASTTLIKWFIESDHHERLFNRDFNSVEEAQTFIDNLTPIQLENIKEIA